MREAPEKRLFVHLPSVRSCLPDSLSRWAVHAIEARAAPGQGAEIISRLEAAASNARGKNAGRLARIARELGQRKLFGKKYPGEIHFIVADSAPYYHEKAFHETHSEEANELFKAINAAANPAGVFIHHLTSRELGRAFLEGKPRKDGGPFFHFRGGKPKLSPGGGTNAALSYAAALSKGTRGEAEFLRVSDDIYPPTGRVSFQNRVGHRNFFADLALDEPPQEPRTYSSKTGVVYERKPGYRGYLDNTGARAGAVTPTRILLRSGTPDKIRYYATAVNEDLTYPERYAKPKKVAPNWLVHAGGVSTTLDKSFECFGTYAGRRTVRPFPIRAFRLALENSGIKAESLKG